MVNSRISINYIHFMLFYRCYHYCRTLDMSTGDLNTDLQSQRYFLILLVALSTLSSPTLHITTSSNGSISFHLLQNANRFTSSLEKSHFPPAQLLLLLCVTSLLAMSWRFTTEDAAFCKIKFPAVF